MDNLFYLLIIISLIATLVFTHYYHQKQINVLIDKAMSKSYHEYVQTKNLEQVERFPIANTQEKPDVSDDAVLSELNQLIR